MMIMKVLQRSTDVIDLRFWRKNNILYKSRQNHEKQKDETHDETISVVLRNMFLNLIQVFNFQKE